MEFEGAVTIEADSQFVWDRVSDPAVLMDCVPGAKEVNRESETKYTGIIERTLARVTVEFDGAAEILELDAPEKIVASATGEDSRTNSRLDADLTMEITPEGTASDVGYTIDIAFTGRLASLGSRIVKRKINADINSFLDNVKSRIESDDIEQA